MTFTSPLFFLFLAVVWALHHVAPARLKAPVLILAGCAFYASFKAPQLLLALLLVTLAGYVSGKRLGRTTDDSRRRRELAAGVLACLAVLGAIKYLPELLPPGFRGRIHPNLLMTLGVSYFTFQAVSYLVDVYLGVVEPEPDPVRHALAMSFFPKLLQGPIERAGDLFPQFAAPYRFDYGRMRSGLVLMAWGLCKKLAIADRLAPAVNTAYADTAAADPRALVFAAFAYTFQIYYDFSGYTDMARGAARLFGIELSENFNLPYRASSIGDFWRRWHMSFSRWILDYLFRPLQMAWRDRGKAGTAAALLATFAVSGLWHGAAWGFMAWGLFHGLCLALSTFWTPVRRNLFRRFRIPESAPLRLWRVFITFNLVNIAWVFFRSPSIPDALRVLAAFPAGIAGLFAPGGVAAAIPAGYGAGEAAIAGVAILAAGFVQGRVADPACRARFFGSPALLRRAAYCLLILATVFFGVTGGKNFVYAQF